ncbi:hypothetical protein BD779DRAFT_1475654 [Infundibulicybe gibba]|nr:hypothetical protein BD779DRAFT_1475654 [Infundibulicybe gibba]
MSRPKVTCSTSDPLPSFHTTVKVMGFVLLSMIKSSFCPPVTPRVGRILTCTPISLTRLTPAQTHHTMAHKPLVVSSLHTPLPSHPISPRPPSRKRGARAGLRPRPCSPPAFPNLTRTLTKTNGRGPWPADDTWARKYQARPIDDDSNDDWRPKGRQMSKRRPKNEQQLSANDVRMHKQANNRRAVCAWLVLAPRAASTPLERCSPRHSTCAMISQGELRVLVARDLPGATLLTTTRANLRVTCSDTSRRAWRPYPLANERAPGVHSGIAATALQGATPTWRPRLIRSMTLYDRYDKCLVLLMGPPPLKRALVQLGIDIGELDLHINSWWQLILALASIN